MLTQTNFQGVVQGDRGQLPAGELKLALLARPSQEHVSIQPGFAARRAEHRSRHRVAASQGEYDVDEFAAQIDVPIC